MEKIKTAKIRKSHMNSHSAMEKSNAVLSLWTEKRKPSEICREFEITWGILRFWENRALEGMMQALEPRVNLEKGPALSERLQRLIQKKTNLQKDILKSRLEKRLVKIQEEKAQDSPQKK